VAYGLEHDAECIDGRLDDLRWFDSNRGSTDVASPTGMRSVMEATSSWWLTRHSPASPPPPGLSLSPRTPTSRSQAGPRGDVLTAKAVEKAKFGRSIVYDVTVTNAQGAVAESHWPVPHYRQVVIEPREQKDGRHD
jgi:hypothetical protein